MQTFWERKKPRLDRLDKIVNLTFQKPFSIVD